MQYTTENTEGYSSEDLETLNWIYEHRIALLDEDGRENRDLLQHISEEVLADYDLARDLVPVALLDGDGREAPITKIVDLEIRGSGDDRAAVALVDVRDADGYDISGVAVICYPGGVVITQRDWETCLWEIPEDLVEVAWPREVIVCEDGLPRYLPGPW